MELHNPLLPAARTEPESTREITPHEAALFLYDMGWRLTAPLDTILTDTNKEIVLHNIYAPILEKDWADGTDRNVEEFYSLLNIPEDDDYSEMSVSTDLYQLSHSKPKRGGSHCLIGTKDEHSFLVDQKIRQAWGDTTCYIALIQAGEKPWEWVPKEMIDATAQDLRQISPFCLFDQLPDSEQKKNTIFFDIALQHPKTIEAVLSNMIEAINLDYYYPRKFRAEALAFIETCKTVYPEITERVFHDVVVQYKENHPSHQGYSPNVFFRALGEDYVKRWADAQYPKRNDRLDQWAEYYRAITGEDDWQLFEGKLVSVRDHSKTFPPAYPVFEIPDLLSLRGTRRYDFINEANLTHAYEELTRELAYLQEKIAIGKKALQGIKNLQSSLTNKKEPSSE